MELQGYFQESYDGWFANYTAFCAFHHIKFYIYIILRIYILDNSYFHCSTLRATMC